MHDGGRHRSPLCRRISWAGAASTGDGRATWSHSRRPVRREAFRHSPTRSPALLLPLARDRGLSPPMSAGVTSRRTGGSLRFLYPARARASGFLAAFTSRSWRAPHAGRTHSRTSSGRNSSTCPQHEHIQLPTVWGSVSSCPDSLTDRSC